MSVCRLIHCLTAARIDAPAVVVRMKGPYPPLLQPLPMKSIALSVALVSALVAPVLAAAAELRITKDVPYVKSGHERQVLDIYAAPGAKNAPVVFWIHGGGWQTGDKSSVQQKPQALVDKGFVFVSTNYRLLPDVDMRTINHDLAKSIRWVYENIAAHGGDPRRIIVGGHSAGAQLAALLCTDDRLVRLEGVPFSALKGCIPVDGDTFDVPAIVANGNTRRKLHGQPEPKFGHFAKFGGSDALNREYSAVTHVARGKGIPPFFILHITENPDTAAQAFRLGTVLKEAGVPAKVFGAREATHNSVNAKLGTPGDPATKELYAFLDGIVKP